MALDTIKVMYNLKSVSKCIYATLDNIENEVPNDGCEDPPSQRQFLVERFKLCFHGKAR